MSALRTLLRIFSFCYHGLLTLFLLAISMLAWSSGQALHLGMLPWQGRTLTHGLFFAALAGLVSLLLALRRTWGWLFFLWSLAVLMMMVRGFAGGYHFAGLPQFRHALYLAAGALVAVWGAWLQWRRAPARLLRVR